MDPSEMEFPSTTAPKTDNWMRVKAQNMLVQHIWNMLAHLCFSRTESFLKYQLIVDERVNF